MDMGGCDDIRALRLHLVTHSPLRIQRGEEVAGPVRIAKTRHFIRSIKIGSEARAEIKRVAIDKGRAGGQGKGDRGYHSETDHDVLLNLSGHATLMHRTRKGIVR